MEGNGGGGRMKFKGMKEGKGKEREKYDRNMEEN